MACMKFASDCDQMRERTGKKEKGLVIYYLLFTIYYFILRSPYEIGTAGISQG